MKFYPLQEFSMNRLNILWVVGVLLFVAACTSTTANEPAILPTQMTLTPVVTTPVASPGLEPTVPSTPTPALEPTAPALSSSSSFQVAFVASDDTLNVRAGPGVSNDVVAELSPTATGIRITGDGQQVGTSLWVPIQAGNVTGWVNSQYLTETIAEADFCEDAAAIQLITDLRQAVDNRNGTALAGLVHPQRGLTLHRHWWNPAVNIPPTTVANAFDDPASYYWGTEDGSGFDINGSFRTVALPLLDRNLLLGSETACNKILNGSTTGLLQLPDGYEQLNFFSVYRPAVDIEFDWGSWVIGVERVSGRYVISYLVHFAYEI